MTDSRRHARSSAAGLAGKVSVSVVSAVVLIALIPVFVCYRPWMGLVDDAGGAAAGAYDVSTERIEQYCPGRMALMDSDSYGDSEFQASSGNITSSARYAALGSVYMSSVTPMADADAEAERLSDGDDADAIAVLSGAVDDGPTLFDTRLTASEDGTGAAGSVASWATDGDLRGVAAATCVVPSLSQSFMLPATATGTTQELVVSNPSDRATAVTMRVWGSSDGEAISLTTGNTLTVDAHGESSVDLAAAASGQDGLFVTLDSDETPVAAVVRMTRMDGLNPQGIDYIPPVSQSSSDAVIPSVREGDAVRVTVRAEETASVTVSWLTAQGTTAADEGQLDAGRVTMFDLGEAPEHTLGVVIESDAAVNAMAFAERGGDDGQSDFTVALPGTAAAASAVAVPSDTRGELTVANVSGERTSVTMHAYDADGRHVGERQIDLEDGAAVDLAVTDLGEDAAVIMVDDPSESVVWGVRLSQPDVDESGLAGLANLQTTALTPVQETVLSQSDRAVIR